MVLLIVGDKHAALMSCPLKDHRVRGLSQTYLLNAQSIEGRRSAAHSTDDLPVKILVEEVSNRAHAGWLYDWRRASMRLRRSAIKSP